MFANVLWRFVIVDVALLLIWPPLGLDCGTTLAVLGSQVMLLWALEGVIDNIKEGSNQQTQKRAWRSGSCLPGRQRTRRQERAI